MDECGAILIVLSDGDEKKQENVEEGGGELSYHVLFIYDKNSFSVISFSLVHGKSRNRKHCQP